MKKIRTFNKAWWVTALVLFVAVTLLFPFSVQADPGTLEPPKKITTMYAEEGYFSARKTYTVLLWIHHTDDLEMVHIGHSLSWLPIIGRKDRNEVTYLHQPIWTHDRCIHHDKILVTGGLFRGHIMEHPFWSSGGFGAKVSGIHGAIDAFGHLVKSAATKMVGNVITLFELYSIIGKSGSGEVIDLVEVYVDINDDTDAGSQYMRFEPRKEYPDGYSLTYYGYLELISSNEEVGDTSGLCAPNCSDSDGKNIYEFGKITGADESGLYEYWDSCSDDHHVQEMLCEEFSYAYSEVIECPPTYLCQDGVCLLEDLVDLPIISCSENDLYLISGTWDDGLIGFEYPPGSVSCNPVDDCPEGSKCDFDACFCLPPGGWDEILKGGELSIPLPTAKAPTPTSVPPAPTPTLSRLDIILRFGNFTEEQKAQIALAYLLDPEGDWIYSISTQVILEQLAQTDIMGYLGIWLRLNSQAAGSWFNNSYFPCNQEIPGGIVVCPESAADMPEGRILMLVMQLAEPVPLADSDHFYTYAAVLDADGNKANNFQFNPPYDWDYWQNTDRWYILDWNPELGSWSFNVPDINKQSFSDISNARAVIYEDMVVFFIPADEFSVDYPAFRLSAFGHDGSYSPDVSSGDVTGANPGEELLQPIEEEVLIEE